MNRIEKPQLKGWKRHTTQPQSTTQTSTPHSPKAQPRLLTLLRGRSSCETEKSGPPRLTRVNKPNPDMETRWQHVPLRSWGQRPYQEGCKLCPEPNREDDQMHQIQGHLENSRLRPLGTTRGTRGRPAPVAILQTEGHREAQCPQGRPRDLA